MAAETALLLAVLAVASCDKKATPPSPAQVKAAAAQISPAAPSKAQVESYRALLRDGRRAVQAKRFADGIALYEKALALRPGDPRLLVELGWAAFLSGDLDRAASATRRGLAGVRGTAAEGAALYNLGRIAEQRGDKNEAARRYRESLAVRPNAAVRERLGAVAPEAALAAATQTEQATAAPEVGPLEGPLPSLDAVCAALRDEIAAGDSSGALGCAKDEARTLEIGEGGLRRAWLLPIWRNYNGGGLDDAAEVHDYLVVETDRGLYRTRAEVAYVYNPGAFGIFEDLDASLSLEELVAGPPKEIVVRATHHRADTDLGILEQESETEEWTLVCGLVDGAPRCLARIPTSFEYERDIMQADAIDPGEPIEHTAGLPFRSSYAFKVEFDGKGGYAISQTATPVGDAAARAGAHAGTFSLLGGEPPLGGAR